MFEGHVIAVVVPAFREEMLLERTLSGIPEFVDRVIVVDDASDDATAEIARSASARDQRIDVVSHLMNQGVGAAIITGYRHAIGRGADIAAVMAADDQMDPDDLALLLAPVAEGRADYVKGNRWAHPEARKMPLVRRIGSQLLGALTGWVAGVGALNDAQCGYTALRLAVCDQVPLEAVWPRYGYPNDMLLRLAEVDARIVEVPVRPVYADEVSGFVPHQVIVPITRILARGLVRRADLLLDE